MQLRLLNIQELMAGFKLIPNINLNDYLSSNTWWSNVSRFETVFPRDHSLNSAAVESLNRWLKENHCKEAEPPYIFEALYNYGYNVIQTISMEIGMSPLNI